MSSFKKFQQANKQKEIKSKPRAGWDDNENIYPRISSINSPFSSNTNNEETNNQGYIAPALSSNKNHNSEQKSFNVKSVIHVEYKILDDLIQPSGISMKPNDNLLKEFVKRCKTLDKDLIFNYLMEKLNNYPNYESDKDLKSFCKCLYVVDGIISNKVDYLFQAFTENREIFSAIKNSYGDNKKFTEVINLISIGVGLELEGNIPKTNKKTPEINLIASNNSNLNLFEDFNTGDLPNNKRTDQSNLLDINKSDSYNIQKNKLINNTNDLFDLLGKDLKPEHNNTTAIDLFSFSNNSNNSIQNNYNTHNDTKYNKDIDFNNIFGDNSKSQTNSICEKKIENNSMNKNFSFIKKINNNLINSNNQNIGQDIYINNKENDSNKNSRNKDLDLLSLNSSNKNIINDDSKNSNKGFSFIKKSKVIEDNLSLNDPIAEKIDILKMNDILKNEIFNTQPQSNNFLDISKINQPTVDELFEMGRNKKSTINWNQLEQIYTNPANNKNYSKETNLQHFNASLVYNNIIGNEKDQDPFSFVNDMLKQK